jgi:hypothetical protein
VELRRESAPTNAFRVREALGKIVGGELPPKEKVDGRLEDEIGKLVHEFIPFVGDVFAPGIGSLQPLSREQKIVKNIQNEIC